MHSVHFVLFGILDALGLAITGSTWLTWVMWLYRAFWMLGVRLGCVSLPRHHLIQASHCDNLSNRKETQTHLYSVLAFAGPSSRPLATQDATGALLVYTYIKSERLLASGEVAARAGRETTRCITYPVSLGVGLQAFTPVPHLLPGLVQLLNKPRRRALQTQSPPTRAPVARLYLTLGRWNSVAGVG